jgi:hypothetical protein
LHEHFDELGAGKARVHILDADDPDNARLIAWEVGTSVLKSREWIVERRDRRDLVRERETERQRDRETERQRERIQPTSKCSVRLLLSSKLNPIAKPSLRMET